MGNRRLHKSERFHTLGTSESERLKVTALPSPEQLRAGRSKSFSPDHLSPSSKRSVSLYCDTAFYRAGHPADLPAIFLVVGAGFLAQKWSQVCRNRPFGEGVVEPVLSIPLSGVAVALFDSVQTDRQFSGCLLPCLRRRAFGGRPAPLQSGPQ